MFIVGIDPAGDIDIKSISIDMDIYLSKTNKHIKFNVSDTYISKAGNTVYISRDFNTFHAFKFDEKEEAIRYIKDNSLKRTVFEIIFLEGIGYCMRAVVEV